MRLGPAPARVTLARNGSASRGVGRTKPLVHARPGRRWSHLLLCRSATTYRSGRVNPGTPTSDPPLRGGRHAERACRAGRWLPRRTARAGDGWPSRDPDRRGLTLIRRRRTRVDDWRRRFACLLRTVTSKYWPAFAASPRRRIYCRIHAGMGKPATGEGEQSCSDTVRRQASRPTTAPTHGVGPGGLFISREED